jgi:alpha-amylase/alpha-mannosidase (GH57 family)
MERFICIHGHFYQPPRENPWLEAIETQDSAFPYHDWNERVTAECYAPNSASRILDGEHRITDIVSNYSKISFNFGPTLLSWMERSTPEVYQAILDADRQSMGWHSGHGAAIAQVYNHLIMPLATARDKRTQVIWGIKDFEYRFKRFPEGMWLAETAVDMETLEILAEQGIKYTVLAQHQAARFRKIGEEKWEELEDGLIDPTRVYLCQLPSQRTISIFFYDATISRAVAFENLLDSGERFAQRLLEGFSDSRDWPQFLHIATDGETYGHHRKFGDMALAATLDYIEANKLARLSNYGEYLAHNSPTHEAQIREGTSWSCFHGVERWRGDCGCNSGGHPDWNQKWRAPLRTTLDWLGQKLANGYAMRGMEYLKDPWLARDKYIDVVLDQSPENAERFLTEHAARVISREERTTVLRLLEMQRNALLMYTSCGWFFDELSGIETVQVMQYAGRALQLAEGVVGNGLESAFMEKIRDAKSNIPAFDNGAHVYEQFVIPGRVDLSKVAAHFAFSSLFEEYGKQTRIFRYTVTKEEYERLTAETASLALGKIAVTSDITAENSLLMFCVIRFSSHDFKGGLSPFMEEGAYAAMKEEIGTAFEKGYYTEIIGLMDKHFGMHHFSLANLFRDEKLKILDIIIKAALKEFEETYLSMYEHNRSLMEFVQETGTPLPKSFLSAAELTLSAAFKEALTEEKTDPLKIKKIVDYMGRWNVAPDSPRTEFFIRHHLEDLMTTFSRHPSKIDLLIKIRQLLELLRPIQTDINTWYIQNIYNSLAKTAYWEYLGKSRAGDGRATEWVEAFRQLGELLNFNLDAVLQGG